MGSRYDDDVVQGLLSPQINQLLDEVKQKEKVRFKGPRNARVKSAAKTKTPMLEADQGPVDPNWFKEHMASEVENP